MVEKNEKYITLEKLRIDSDEGLERRILRNKVMAKLILWIEAKTKIDENKDDFIWQIGKDTKPYFKNWTSNYLRKMIYELEEWGLVEKKLSSGNATIWRLNKDKDGNPVFRKYLKLAKMSYKEGKW